MSLPFSVCCVLALALGLASGLSEGAALSEALGGLLASEVDTPYKICHAPASSPYAASPELKLGDLKNKVVVLQSAPSNCPAVEASMPAYSQYAAQVKGDAELGDNVVFLTSLWYTHSEADCEAIAESGLRGRASSVEAAVEKAEAN